MLRVLPVIDGWVSRAVTATLLIAMLASGLGVGQVDAAAQPIPEKVVQVQKTLPPAGRVIVVLDPGTAATQVALSVDALPRQLYGEVFDGFAATLSSQEIQELARNPAVQFLAGDKPVSAAAQAAPTGVRRVAATGNAVAAIDGVDNPMAADVAIIDTGIDPTHPDLNVAGGVDCVAGDGKNSYADDSPDGHGTHVAGTAAARDNGTGVVGVAPGAALWAVKVLNAGGGGVLTDVLCGLDWVAANANRVDVANMSLEGTIYAEGTCANPNADALHEAICSVVDAGVTVVAAAGNSDEDAVVTVPAKYAEVIAVSAVTDYDGQPGRLSGETYCHGADDTFATFSNYGAVVDIGAPGSCIESTLPGGRYGTLDGTSMAAPHVAGAAALFRSRNFGASPADVRSWLLSEASQPQGSVTGFSGDPDGSAEPILALAASITGERFPPGDPNPSFGGSRLNIVASSTSAGTTASTLAHDGNVGTAWQTTSPQTRATLSLDIGSIRTLTGMKWTFQATGGADEVLIQTSPDNVSWRTVGRYGNAPAAGSWYGEDLARDGRYVRLTFLNPNGDEVLGSMAEVQIWGGVIYPMGTADPRLSGSKLTIARSFGSSNANAPKRAHDGSASTSWETTATTPASGELKLDLGSTRRISGVKWRFRTTGNADDMLIQTSIDNASWRTLGRYGNAPAGRVYGGASVRDARYIRITFRNPNRDIALGYLAEVEVWGSTTTASSSAARSASVRPTKTPTVTPTPSPSPTATATATVSPMSTATAPPTATATATAPPTASSTAAEPTASPERSGVVVGTGGEGVRCRVAPSVDAEVINVSPEGSQLAVIGEAVEGWSPVRCGDADGFVRTEFLAVDGVMPEPAATAKAPTTDASGAQPTIEPTAAPAVTPTPYIVVGAGDTEQSGTAAVVIDGDPTTAWFVTPAMSPNEARLLLDLGEVQPVSRVEWDQATSGTLGVFEIWLSTDNETWWSLGPIDGTVLAPGGSYAVEVGSQVRFVAFVLPNVSGQNQVGGFGEVRIWPAESAAPLTDRGAPVTPTPEVEAAVLPTEPPAAMEEINESTAEDMGG